MALDALDGFTIGITADRRWEQQADLLARRGAEILHGPTMATRYLAETADLQAATARVSEGVDYTVVTTGIGVRAWFEAAEAHGGATALRQAVDRSRILCRGPKAAAALLVAGVTTLPVLQSDRLAELLDPGHLSGMDGARVAFQHHGEAEVEWVRRLEDAGALVTAVPVYRWEMPPSLLAAERLVRATCEGKIDAVTFTSAPAVANLLSVADELGLRAELLSAFNDRDVVAACVGPVCATGAVAQGILAPVAPEVGRMGLLVRVVTDALAARRVGFQSSGVPVVLQGKVLAVGEETVRLPGTERGVVAVLARRPGAVLSKPMLARRLNTTTRAIEAAVGRLRHRLRPTGVELVQTVAMRGYRLNCTPR